MVATSRRWSALLLSLSLLTTAQADSLQETRDKIHGGVAATEAEAGTVTLGTGSQADSWETATGVDIESQGSGSQLEVALPRGFKLLVTDQEGEFTFQPGEGLQVRLGEVRRAFGDAVRAGLLTPDQIPAGPEIPGGLGTELQSVAVAFPLSERVSLLGGVGRIREYLIVGHGQPGAGGEALSWESEFALLGVGFKGEDGGFWMKLGLDIEPVDKEITQGILETSPDALEIPEGLRQFALAGWRRLGSVEVGAGIELQTFGGVGVGANVDLYATRDFGSLRAGVTANLAEGPASRRELTFQGTFLRQEGPVWTAKLGVIQKSTSVTVPPSLQVLAGIDDIQQVPSFELLGRLNHPSNADLEPREETLGEVLLSPGFEVVFPRHRAAFSFSPMVDLAGEFRGFEAAGRKAVGERGLAVQGAFGQLDDRAQGSVGIRVPGSFFRGQRMD